MNETKENMRKLAEQELDSDRERGYVLYEDKIVHSGSADTVTFTITHFGEEHETHLVHTVATGRASEEQTLRDTSRRQDVIAAPAGQEYVDPFLFETGHFESREEYDELMRTAKIKPRTRA